MTAYTIVSIRLDLQPNCWAWMTTPCYTTHLSGLIVGSLIVTEPHTQRALLQLSRH